MLRNHEDAFTGLEAAIVLIAFVVVAAVFSYVVLGAGFFTTQKAQETVYKGVEQATANLQMIGNVYAFNQTALAGEKQIDEIKLTLTVAPGAPSVDLTRMKILFSTPNSAPVVISQNTTAAAVTTIPTLAYFTTKLTGGVAVTSMSAGDQVELDIYVAGVPKSTSMNFEIRPAVGAALPFTKTTPATIEKTNILY
jgi:flagellin FlaB